MLVPRAIYTGLEQLLREYPVVTILGPRQAGKTTLARHFLEGYSYANLEDPEQRELASTDPKAFFASLSERAIIDEIQRVPDLLSYNSSRTVATSSPPKSNLPAPLNRTS